MILAAGTVAVVAAIGVPIASLLAWAWLREHVLPAKPYWVGLAPNLPRRHLESLSAWAERHAAAMDRLHDAQHAMTESPDATWRRVSARGSVVSLPANHPLTLRALFARYPDGPSFEELCEIAGIEPKQETTMGLTTETGIATASENTPDAAADLKTQVQTNEMTPDLAKATKPQDAIMKFFEYGHLPDALKEVSRPWCELANHVATTIPPCAERTVALRKLLEGKDAAVRAALP